MNTKAYILIKDKLTTTTLKIRRVYRMLIIIISQVIY